MVNLLASLLSLNAHGAEGGYRLLELDGYEVKWGSAALGTPARISYAFAERSRRFGTARNCRAMAPMAALASPELPMATIRRETAAAFQAWEQAAGLSFYEVDDSSDADIVLGTQAQPHGRAFANVSYAPGPEAGVRSIEQALVCLNADQEWKVGFDGDKDVYDLRYTLTHEIGHTVGLDHTGPSGQVMAFGYTEAFDDLQPGDLRGVRRLYGRDSDDFAVKTPNEKQSR